MNPAVVITGGASAIGLAVAERLLDDGWYVTLIDSDSQAIAEAEDRLAGEEVTFLTADVTDEDEMARAFDDAVGAYGLLAGLVSGACIQPEQMAEETSAELLRQVLDINVAGAFIAAQAALTRMGQELSIVNLTSVSGLRAIGGEAAFGASQAAVKMMSEVMALELAGRGVRVNCVAAGLVDRPSEAFEEVSRHQRDRLIATPQRRAASPRDIAAAIAYLMSAEAGFVTGHTLVVDGGFSIAGVPPVL